MKLSLKIVIGVLISLVILNGLWVIYNIRKEIQFNRELTQKQININDSTIKDIYMHLYNIDKTIYYINKSIEILNKSNERTINIEKLLNQKIKSVPELMRINKERIEQKLKQINVRVVNQTQSAIGSGVTLKYKGKFYVLSAGHMANLITNNFSPQDSIELWENNSKVCDLKVIKHAFNFPTKINKYKDTGGVEQEEEQFDSPNVQDLTLFAPVDENIKPNIYVELGDTEPIVGTEVYIVGNPAGLDDIISVGRIAFYKTNIMYITDNIYYGNSGGGVYTLDGKLIGIVSHLIPFYANPFIPPYMIYGIVRLDVIVDFLKGIE